MKPVLSPDKEKVGPPPGTAGTEYALLRSTDARSVDNKNAEFGKYCVATGIIVTPTETGKNTAAVILYIEHFNSRLSNEYDNTSWRMDLGDTRYRLRT